MTGPEQTPYPPDGGGDPYASPAGGSSPYGPVPGSSSYPPPPRPGGYPSADPYRTGAAPSADPYRAADSPRPTVSGSTSTIPPGYLGTSGGPGSGPRAGVGRGKVAAISAATGAVGLVVGLALGGAFGADEDGAPVASSPSPSDEPSSSGRVAPRPPISPDDPGLAPSTEPADGAEGSRENPYPVGTTVTGEEWEVTLGEPREAWAEIEAESECNEPPAEGMEYWLVPVSATYVGAETGLPGVDLTVAFVGADARTYDDRCGYGQIPDELDGLAELYPGGTTEGNVCVTVPAGTEGVWALTTLLGDRVFFAAG